MMDKDVFVSRLKTALQESGLTQKTVAEKANVSAQAFSAYLKKNSVPSIDVAVSVANALNVSLDWLVGLSENMRCVSEVSNYGDAIKAILSIEKDCSDPVEFSSVTVCEEKDASTGGGYPAPIDVLVEYPALIFKDEKLKKFFEDQKKMRALLWNGEKSDMELYSQWENTRIEDLSKIKISEFPF